MLLLLTSSLLWFRSGTSADIMKVGGYKLSALEIESTLLEVMLTSLDFLNVIQGIRSSFLLWKGKMELKMLIDISGLCDIAPQGLRMLRVGVTRQRLWRSCYCDNCSRYWSKEEKWSWVKTCNDLRRTLRLGSRQACSLQGTVYKSSQMISKRTNILWYYYLLMFLPIILCLF